MHRTAAQIERMAEKRRVAIATLNQALLQVGDGLLTEDELTGLEASLPVLFGLAEEMGITEKPMTEWSKQEIVRLLAVAVRGAVPLRVVGFALATDNDGMGDIPF